MTYTTIRSLAKAVAVTTLLLSSSFAYANLIDSIYGVGAGSFELGSFSASFPGAMRLSPGSTAITGWTIGGPGGIDWLSEPIYNADTGLRSLDLQAATGGSIFTSIPTTIGEEYILSFSAVAGLNGIDYASVSAGSLVNQVFYAPRLAVDPATMPYTLIEYSFTAIDLMTTITFASTAPVYGVVIDSVSVESATTVPLPSSLWLFFSGLSALIVRQIKEKRRRLNWTKVKPRFTTAIA